MLPAFEYLSYGLQKTAAQVGGRTLLSRTNLVGDFQAALSDLSTRFTLSLDGLAGDSVESKIFGAAQRGANGLGNGYTNYEIGQLYQSGRLGGTSPGRRIYSKPFRTVMTHKQLFATARHFQLWSYIVSHRQVLLRSPKSQNWPKRVDVLFKDVSHICLGTRFEGLLIHEMTAGSGDLPFDGSRIPTGHRLFRLQTNTSLGYIVAATFHMFEDEKEYYDDSALIGTELL